MIYEVVATDLVLNACGLVCLARPNKECQFFMPSSTGDICSLGSFDNTVTATAVTGEATIYINYGTFYLLRLGWIALKKRQKTA